MVEERRFPPPDNIASRANVKDPAIYEEALADREAYWAGEAGKLHWFKDWDKVLEWNPPFAKWFIGGELNVSYNCIDRHLDDRGDKVAFHWVGEPGDTRTLTFKDLYFEVCRFANALKHLGVRRGDRVAIYMGMIPELPIAMLACARIGAPHTVVFGGFSSDALADRINDTKAKVLITQDGANRRGQVFPLKDNADAAIESTPSVESVVVVERCNNEVTWVEGRDHRWTELVESQVAECPPEEMDAEDVLYILYTSGTTAKPKGIVHSTGGYLTQVASTHRMVFDIKDDDVYWCAADIGWVTGHSYIVYGPLANGCTGVIYEGTPDYPEKDRLWQIAEDYKVTILYTAPTAIRTFMRWGTEWPERHDLSSLRILGSVGEPINPEAWMWYRKHIGGDRCPIVDTWWQTETGAIMISPLPGITTTKPGSATFPLPGVVADVYDEQGESVHLGGGGYLVLKQPWPSMIRTIYGDQDRYVETYWSRYDKETYFAGDGCKRDEEGYFWLMGRIDDVMNVSGHRISTAEVESALVAHPSVAEAAVVGRNDEITGQAIAAFVTLRGGEHGDEALISELRDHVAEKIGKIAKPQSIVFTDDLPKTRSGKIMRRLLRDISEHRKLGDITTLANADIVDEISKLAAASPGED
ncbi:MAG: acetate--CoA ligase [Acidobacteria bacterium]|nr:MAG: acetate--CoA ligase [Acidobacteriota bacterium]